MLKRKLKGIIYNLPIKMKKNILLESIPAYSDNTKYVFDEIIKRRINERYRIYWLTNENIDRFRNIVIKNVFFINQENKTLFNKLKLIKLRIFSKCIIDCNYYIKKMNKNQIRIHLTHGMPIKLTYEYCSQSGNFDYAIVTSDYFTEAYMDLFKVEKEKILTTGYPRNDAIFNTSKKEIYPEIKRDKTILWMPTYRNHKNGNSYENKTGVHFKYGVPCIDNEKQLLELNQILSNNKILLIIKLHPAEDTTDIKRLNLSNIKILDNSYFIEKNETIYDYLNSIDALITDYSSIYYDFLLTGENIGLAIPDIEQYSKHVKLFTNNFTEDIVGEFIYKYEDLIKFINNVSIDNDTTIEKRKELQKRYHKYIDGNSSKRIVDILEKTMKE